MRRRLAKTLYLLGGVLGRVKTPRRVYRLVSIKPFVSEPAGRRWLPCRWSTRLIRLSAQLDWDHWDHWALVHEHCDPTPCPVCGGCVCDNDKEDE